MMDWQNLYKVSLDEFGLWEAKLDEVDADTLYNGNLYVARTSVSSSDLKAWWRFGDDIKSLIEAGNTDWDKDSSRTLTTGDYLKEQQSSQHATASINSTDLDFIDPIYLRNNRLCNILQLYTT